MAKTNEFSRVLSECRGGLVLRSLDQELEKVVTACQYAGKKGSITVTLNIDPHGKENREMHVSAKVVAKAPPEPGLDERSIFYAERGQLSRHDPGQRDLYRGPQSVDGGNGEEEEAGSNGKPRQDFGNA